MTADPKVAKRQEIERKIVEKLVDDALARGLLVTVDYGMSQGATRSTDKAQIMGALFACDEERIRFHEVISGVRRVLGWVLLVYGNDGHNVIADYTATDTMIALLASAEALALELADAT